MITPVYNDYLLISEFLGLLLLWMNNFCGVVNNVGGTPGSILGIYYFLKEKKN
jgi:hypothetical protein